MHSQFSGWLVLVSAFDYRNGGLITMSADRTIEAVLVAAGLPDEEIWPRLAHLGPEVVAEAVLAEVISRTSLIPGPSDPFMFQCDLGFGADRLGYLLRFGEGAPTLEKGWDRTSAATVRQDLVDLLRETFGPAGPYGVTRELHAKEYDTSVYSASVAAQMWRVIGAMSQRPKDLAELAARFGSDKWGGRWYAAHYQQHFEPYRQLPVRVLELGVGGYDAPDVGGESLRMWKHYFRRGLIYGLDVFPKVGVEESRLRVVQGDQGDKSFLDSIARELGPFDIIIDDGSHMSHHVIASFEALFPHVKLGGLYVVEDLATAYWPSWGGDPDPSAQYRTIDLVKSLVDGVHHQERMPDSGEPSATDLSVTGLHVYHNLAVIEKGINSEQGAPAALKGFDHTASYRHAAR